MTVAGGGFPKLGEGSALAASLIVAAYRKARDRASETDDTILRRAMGAGVQDFMLQIMKLVDSLDPALLELLDGFDKPTPPLVKTKDGWRDLETPEDAARLDAAHRAMFPEPTRSGRWPLTS